MSIYLTTNILLKSVGKQVKDDEDKYLGEIVEVTRNSNSYHIEYAILKSDQLFDNEERFFAIPACSSLLEIKETGEIILLVSKEELHLSDAIMGKRCPSPNFDFKPAIFELFGYERPETENHLMQDNWANKSMNRKEI